MESLSKTIWIDKQEYNWVKAEAEAIDTMSFGLFVARVHKGSRFSFEQVRLNNEVWLLRRFYLNASARLLLFKNEAIEQEDTFSNYKKFVTGTKILPGVVTLRLLGSGDRKHQEVPPITRSPDHARSPDYFG